MLRVVGASNAVADLHIEDLDAVEAVPGNREVPQPRFIVVDALRCLRNVTA
ncbi:hypothetical protein D3C75_926850 [compost metagenome]